MAQVGEGWRGLPAASAGFRYCWHQRLTTQRPPQAALQNAAYCANTINTVLAQVLPQIRSQDPSVTSIAILEQKYPQFGKAYACKMYFGAGKTRANLCDATCFSTVGNSWCAAYLASTASDSSAAAQAAVCKAEFGPGKQYAKRCDAACGYGFCSPYKGATSVCNRKTTDYPFGARQPSADRACMPVTTAGGLHPKTHTCACHALLGFHVAGITNWTGNYRAFDEWDSLHGTSYCAAIIGTGTYSCATDMCTDRDSVCTSPALRNKCDGSCGFCSMPAAEASVANKTVVCYKALKPACAPPLRATVRLIARTTVV